MVGDIWQYFNPYLTQRGQQDSFTEQMLLPEQKQKPRMFFGRSLESPFSETEQQSETYRNAWDMVRNDPGSAALFAGLSMLAANRPQNGRTPGFGELVGAGGLGALQGMAQMKEQERQAGLDADRKAYRDMQMQGLQANLDEQARRRELELRFAAGDESALKEMDPMGWWKNEQTRLQAEQALQNSMALERYKAGLNAQNRENALQYVDGIGMVDKKTGIVVPLRTPEGDIFLSPKQRKENDEMAKQERVRQSQKDSAIQNARIQMTSLNNALSFIPEEGKGISWDTGLTGSILSLFPGTDARNLQAELDTIRSGAMLQTMQALKAASPTGATGMGALSDSEGKILRDSLGSLDTWQSPEQLRRNLNSIKSIYMNMLASWGYAPDEIAAILPEQKKSERESGSENQGKLRLVYNPATGRFE